MQYKKVKKKDKLKMHTLLKLIGRTGTIGTTGTQPPGKSPLL